MSLRKPALLLLISDGCSTPFALATGSASLSFALPGYRRRAA